MPPLPGEIVIDKPGKGAFYATPLWQVLTARGITSSSSPASRPRSACRRRCARPTTAAIDCLLAEDATESYFPEFKAATLAMIRAQGAIVGWTATTDQVRRALGV